MRAAAIGHYANQPARPFAQFHVERPWGQCLNSVLNVKAVVAAFNLLRDYEPSDGTF